jgi:hypothetical protein
MGRIFGPTNQYPFMVNGVFGFPTPAAKPPLDALVDLAIIDATHIVGVTNTGNAAYSSDGGATTTPVFLPLSNINQFQTVCAGNGIAVAFGQDPNLGPRLATSSDNGHTWTDTTPAGMIGGPNALFFSTVAGNLFVSCQGSGNVTWTSADGVTWTSHAVAQSPQSFGIFTFNRFIETGGNIFIGSAGTGGGKTIAKSATGLSYTTVLHVAGGSDFCTGPVLASGPLFGAAVQTGFFPQSTLAYTSPDGTTWTLKKTNGNPTAVPPYNNMVALGALLVTAAQSGGDGQTCATSADGITWTNHTPGVSGFNANSAPVIQATASNVYLFGQGCIHTPDFSTWSVDVAVGNTVNNVKSGSGRVVACGADGSGKGLFFKLV